jgi:hypothetical protein
MSKVVKRGTLSNKHLNDLNIPETVTSPVLMIPASVRIALLSQNLYRPQIDMF